MTYPHATRIKYQLFNTPDNEFYGDICEATIVTDVTVSPVRDYFAMRELPNGRKHYFSLWSHEIKEVLLDD